MIHGDAGNRLFFTNQRSWESRYSKTGNVVITQFAFRA